MTSVINRRSVRKNNAFRGTLRQGFHSTRQIPPRPPEEAEPARMIFTSTYQIDYLDRQAASLSAVSRRPGARCRRAIASGSRLAARMSRGTTLHSCPPRTVQVMASYAVECTRTTCHECVQSIVFISRLETTAHLQARMVKHMDCW